MTVEPRHVELALDVRRGRYRLRQLQDEDRPIVNYVLNATSDARLAQIAQEQRPHTRERAWTHKQQRG
jgi:hypothetical protein